MSATITLAKEGSTGRVLHINEDVKGKGFIFFCVGCNQEMIAVKSIAQKKAPHFRHHETSDIAKCRSTALHDFAVQILMENTTIDVSEKLQIDYSEPRKEVAVFGKRSDVTVKYQNEDVHFEVFVTHDIDQEKINLYKTNKVKCIRIDLSDKDLLTASPENIIDAVLKQIENKRTIYWVKEESRETGFNWVHVVCLIAAFLGVRYFKSQSLKSRRKYSKK